MNVQESSLDDLYKQGVPTKEGVSLHNTSVDALQIFEGNLPVSIQMDGSLHEYSSEITLKFTGENPGIYVMPLFPPLGNIQIRKSTDIQFSVYHKKYLITLFCRFVGILPRQNRILTSFPFSISMQRQKRSCFRVDVSTSDRVTSEIVRPSGLTLPIKVLDISNRGFGFEMLKPSAAFSHKSNLLCRFSIRNSSIVQSNAIYLDGNSTSKAVSGRCKFLFGKLPHDETSVMNMVSILQREYLLKKQEAFT